MKRKVKTFLIFLSFILLSFLSLFFYFQIHFKEPVIKERVNREIHRFQEKSQTDITWDELEINKKFLSAEFKNLRFKKNNHIFDFEKASLRIHFLKTLLSRKMIFNIQLSGLNFSISDPALQKKEWSFLEGVLLLKKIQNEPIAIPDSIKKSLLLFLAAPLGKIQLTKTHIKAPYFSLKNLEALIKVSPSKARIHFKSPVLIQNSLFHLQNKMLIKKTGMDFESIDIKGGQSRLLFSGSWPFSNKKPAHFKTDMKLFLEDFDKKEEGFFKLSSQASYNQTKGLRGDFDLEILNKKGRLKAYLYHLSSLRMKGQLKKRRIHFELAHFERPGQTFFFENSHLNLDSKLSFKLKSHSYIQSLNSTASGQAMRFDLSGPAEVSCRGRLKTPLLHCQIKAQLKNISWGQSPLIPTLKSRAKLKWEKAHWSLEGLLTGGQTRIQFLASKKSPDRPIEIPFSGVFDLSYLSPLFGKKTKGEALFSQSKLSFGPGQSPVLNVKLELKQLYWSEFFLGRIQADLLLKDQKFHFKNIKGRAGRSRILGGGLLNLNHSMIENLTVEFKPFYLGDFNSRFLGEGEAYLNILNSSLDPKKLNFKWESSFKNAKLFAEPFEALTVNLSSHQGLLNIEEFLALKAKGRIRAQGRLLPSLSAQVKAEGLALEKIQILKGYINPHLLGVLSFESSLKGSIKQPKGQIQTQWKNLVFGGKPLGAAKLSVSAHPKKITGQGSLFKDQMNFDFEIKNLKKPSLLLKWKAKNFDFLPWLTKLSPQSQFLSKVTGRGQFYFPLKNKALVSGFLDLKTLSFKKEQKTLVIDHPFFMKMDRGAFWLKNPSLSLNKGRLNFKKLDKQRTKVSGVFPLEFFHIVWQRADGLKGDLNTHIEFHNHLTKWQPEGSFEVQSAVFNFTKSFDLFQKLDLKGRFKKDHLELSSFSARTSSGQITGEGRMSLSDKKIMDFKGHLDNIVFYLSDTTRLRGSGPFHYFGEAPPYLLSGNFEIIEGFFKADFKKKKKAPLEASLFKKRRELFHLDISLDFKNPFAIENSLMSALLEGAVHFRGRPRSPLVKGVLDFIPGGRLYVREYDFEMTSGQILYNQNKIGSPQMNLIGQTQVQGSPPSDIGLAGDKAEMNYDIRAEIKKQKDDFQIKFTSQPHLSEQEILSMMALGVRSLRLAGGSANLDRAGAAQYSYSQIGYALFQDTIGKGLSDVLGIRFSMTPHINENTKKISTKVWVRKKWYKNLNTSVSTFLNEPDNRFNVEYNLTPRFSLLGTWQDNRASGRKPSVLSFDIEYKWSF